MLVNTTTNGAYREVYKLAHVRM